MAHLNCPTCYHGMWSDQWSQMSESAGSNMSLNLPPGYPANPMWMGTWHGPPPSAMGMYPYPMGMPPMHHVHSSQSSRPTSPAHSVKSRKSHLSKKSRSRRRDSDSDDEDDDVDLDRRSVFSHTERGERKSLNPSRLGERTRLRDTASMPRELPRRSVERLPVTRNHRGGVRSSTSQESEDDRRTGSRKSSEVFEEMDVNEADRPRDQQGSMPKASWECEHCTFVNEAGTRVCIICCKTPTTTNVKLVPIKEGQIVKPKSRRGEPRPRAVRRSISKESSSEIEAITSKIDKLISNGSQPQSDEWKEENNNRKEGRTSRKITFWPGTKFTTNIQQ